MPRRPLLLTAALTAFAWACGTTGKHDAGPPPPPGFSLPADWRTMGPQAFERFLDEDLPHGVPTPLPEPVLEELTAALALQDVGALRAALCLARSRDDAAAEAMLERLELRVLGPARASDPGDVICAAALAERGPENCASRLAALTVGGRPHPDLEVRVECGASALARGRDDVIPFLLQILRLQTFEGRGDSLDFVPAATTAWVRTRAAEALSRRAGIPCKYSSEASIHDREEAARELEQLLLGQE